MPTGPIPKEIRQLGPQEMGIQWADGHEGVYQVRDLRISCRCALCIDEMSGAPRLDPGSVPADVRPVEISAVGNYAVHIIWSDGHQSGIYTYPHLREACQCSQCRP